MLNKYVRTVKVMNRKENITMGDVVDAFPLSKFGRYHLRFRQNQGESYQWGEVQDRSAPAPFYNGGIFLKVLNIGLS